MPEAQLVDLVPVVLAGGSGTRLWPESRSTLPKHLIELLGEGSLLQQTARRISRPAPADRFLTIAAASQSTLVRRQLEALSPVLAQRLVLEPEGRNTAAAVALATLYVAAVWGADRLLWVCPSDHLVERPAELYRALEAGAKAARDGRIVTFGISPTRPETGYGYIRSGAPLPGNAAVLEAEEFKEKPPLAEAEAMLAAGGHAWNSGMFLFRAATMLAELETHAPVILAATRAAMGPIDGGTVPLDPAQFHEVPAAPIDKAVMEVSAAVAVVPCEPGWSDVGSWQAIWEVMPKDASENALRGDALVLRGRRNLVRASTRLVAVAGLDDVAVIETADAVLVTRRDDADAVKATVERLAGDGRPEAVRHRVEPTAWGHRRHLADCPGYRLSELSIDPGAVLELTAGDTAATTWTVIEGEGDAGAAGPLVPGAVVAGDGSELRFANPGVTPLRLLQLSRDRPAGSKVGSAGSSAGSDTP